MYVNPFGIVERRARFWRDKMTLLREEEREGGGRESREGKEMGSNRIVKETSLGRERERHWENDRKVTGTGRNGQTDTANRGNRQRARIDRWKDRGRLTLQLKRLLILLVFVTSCVTQFWYFPVNVIQSAAWHLFFIFFLSGLKPWTTGNLFLMHVRGMHATWHCCHKWSI